MKKELGLQLNMNNLIVKHIAGSHSYGMATPESDLDIRGIFCADKENIVTPFFPIYEKDGDGEDEKYYELCKYMQLYTQGNPNILESLWVDWKDVLEYDFQTYTLIRNHAQALLSKKVAFTFSGYAISQLKRIKGHNKWIVNPQPVDAPVEIDYIKLVQNFTPTKVLPRDFSPRQKLCDAKLIPYGNNIYGLVRDEGSNAFTVKGKLKLTPYEDVEDHYKNCKPDFIIKFCKEEYKRDKETHKNYWTWKKNRNEKRSELEEQYGYDTKHAAHLVRLLRMGEEILTEGVVRVKRPDAEELLAIRRGVWDYDDLIKWAEEKDDLVRGKLYRESKLRKTPDIHLASKVLMSVQEIIWDG